MFIFGEILNQFPACQQVDVMRCSHSSVAVAAMVLLAVTPVNAQNVAGGYTWMGGMLCDAGTDVGTTVKVSKNTHKKCVPLCSESSECSGYT